MVIEIEDIGETIRQLRKRAHLTQTELGEGVGVQKTQILKLEKHSKNMTLKTIENTFKALGYTTKLVFEKL